MTRLHTDREILRCIFDMYAGDYPSKGDPFVEVDLRAISEKLGCDPELLFGRLYFDMGTRLRHRDPKDPNVTKASVFEPQVGQKRHAVNFPYLAATLAILEEKNRRDAWTIGLSIAALLAAVASVVVQLVAWTMPHG